MLGLRIKAGTSPNMKQDTTIISRIYLFPYPSPVFLLPSLGICSQLLPPPPYNFRLNPEKWFETLYEIREKGQEISTSLSCLSLCWKFGKGEKVI
jgi:hypothetical protein